MFKKISKINQGLKKSRQKVFSFLSLKFFPKNSLPLDQKTLDKKLVFNLSLRKVPKLKHFKYLSKVLTSKELWIIRIAIALILICVALLGVQFYLTNFLPAPTYDGEYVEGLIGAPQYINPILSQTNDVDSDISRLIFSGLLKYDKELKLVPDLASDYQISEDQKTYTFNLRKEIFWHDGQKLTADDVIFTVRSIQDPEFKSPLLVSFRGVEVKKINDYQIQFILSEPYAPFLEVSTFGILPEHLWGEIPAINANLTEYNLKPIGSGAWKFKSLTKDKLGNIKSYTLVRNENYYSKKSYLEKIIFKFYPDFVTATQALKIHSVEGISFLPKELKKEVGIHKNLNYYSFYLPQYTAIFLNQKENEVLKEKNVRKALAFSIDKEKILNEALWLEGEIIDGPILPGFIGHFPDIEKISFNPNQAKKFLEEGGWKQITSEDYQNFLKEQEKKAEEERLKTEEQQKTEDQSTKTEEPKTEETKTEEIKTEKPKEEFLPFYWRKEDKILEITLTTVNQPENVTAAQLIKNFWQETGIKVNLNIVDGTKITREVIKPRNYQALLYGIIIGADPDLYPFWHSSQINDPGLNLALFANREVDKLLEEARKSRDPEQRELKYRHFQNILIAELPAIFLYNPTYTYVVEQKIKGINITRIIIPSDRFNNLSEWYIKTVRRWKGTPQ